MDISRLNKEDLEKIDDLLINYKYDKFIRTPMFNTNGAKKYISDKIKEFYSKNPETTVIAKEDGEITGLICFKKIEWDTKHFGFNNAKVEYLITKDFGYENELRIKKELLKKFGDWCKIEKIKFANIKIDGMDYSSIHALEEFGFNYMATLLTTMLDCRNLKDFDIDLKLRNIKENEVETVSKMAEEIFRINRFHLDERFDKKKADELHGEWVKNRYKEDPENIYVLEKDKEIIGFFIFNIEDFKKYFGLNLSYLDLAGISKKYRGRGYDLPLFAGILDIIKKKVEVVYTDFIAENTPILNVYVKLGFRFIDAKLSMHKWF